MGFSVAVAFAFVIGIDGDTFYAKEPLNKYQCRHPSDRSRASLRSAEFAHPVQQSWDPESA
jgi:hypothetical protein